MPCCGSRCPPRSITEYFTLQRCAKEGIDYPFLIGKLSRSSPTTRCASMAILDNVIANDAKQSWCELLVIIQLCLSCKHVAYFACHFFFFHGETIRRPCNYPWCVYRRCLTGDRAEIRRKSEIFTGIFGKFSQGE